MPDIFVGSVAVTVVPEVREFARTIAAKVLPEASVLGDQIGHVLGEKISDGISQGVDRGLARAAKSGTATARLLGIELGNQVRAGIEGQLSQPVTINVVADAAMAESAIDYAARDRFTTVHVQVDESGAAGATGIAGAAAAAAGLIPETVTRLRDPATGRFVKRETVQVQVVPEVDTGGSAGGFLQRIRSALGNEGGAIRFTREGEQVAQNIGEMRARDFSVQMAEAIAANKAFDAAETARARALANIGNLYDRIDKQSAVRVQREIDIAQSEAIRVGKEIASRDVVQSINVAKQMVGDYNQHIAEAIQMNRQWDVGMNRAWTDAIRVNKEFDAGINRSWTDAIRMNREWDKANVINVLSARAAELGYKVKVTPYTPDNELASVTAKLNAWAKANGVKVEVKPEVSFIGSALARMGLANETGKVSLASLTGIGSGGSRGGAGGGGAGWAAAGAAAGRGWGRGWVGALAGFKIPLFAGLFGDKPLVGHIGALGLAVHLLTDFLIVAIPAIVTAGLGLGAFGLAAYASAQRIKTQVQAIDITQAALGKSIPITKNLTTGIRELTNAVRPQVFSLLGGAINALSGNQSILRNLAIDTGRYLQGLFARIDLFVNRGGSGFLKFLGIGTQDMQKFASIGRSLASIFDTILKAGEKTQVSERLLGALATVLQILADVLKAIPQPVLVAVIAIMSIIHYGGLAVTAISGMVTGFIGMAGALASAAIPLAIIAIAAAILYLVYAAHQADGATKNFLGGLDQRLNNMGGGTALVSISSAIGQVTAKIADAQHTLSTGAGGAGWWGQMQRGRTWGDRLKLFFGIGDSTAVNDIKALTAEQKKLIGESNNLGGALVHSMQHGFNFSQSLGVMNAAGVKVTDTLAVMKQKIDNLITGYQAMGQKGGTIGADMNALTVQASDQLKTMGQLNQAWDAFIGNLTAPATSFFAWDSAMATFAKDAQAAGASMQGLGGGAAVKFSAPKVSDAAIALQNQFESVISASQQFFDAMRNSNALGSPVGFTGVVKDMVANLIPLAGNNKAAAAQISALAQEAGGPATTNLSVLAKWEGNLGAAKAANDLYKAQQNAVISTSNLSADAAKLSSTLQQDLVPAMANAVQKASGGPQAMQALANAFVGKGSQITPAMVTSVQGMFNALLKQGITGTNAQTLIQGWIQQMDPKLSKAQIDGFWKGLSKPPSLPSPLVKPPSGVSFSTMTNITSAMAAADAHAAHMRHVLHEAATIPAKAFNGWLPSNQTWKNWMSGVGHFFTSEMHTLWGGWQREVRHVFDDMRHDFAHWFDDARHKIAVLWDGARHEVAHFLANLRHDFAHWYDDTRHGLAHIWDNMISVVTTFFTKTLPGLAGGAAKAVVSALPGGSAIWSVGSKAWHAITGNASGTPFARPGWSWVGERGPELIRLRGGEQILSAAQSQSLSALRGYASGAGTWGGSGGYDDELVRVQRAALGLQREHLEATRNQGREFGRVIEGKGRSASYRSVYGGR